MHGYLELPGKKAFKEAKEVKERKDITDFLLFEKNNGSAKFFCKPDIKQLQKHCSQKLDFVVLNACHSASLASSFLEIAHNVICIN